jgi:general secretion pathway protein A
MTILGTPTPIPIPRKDGPASVVSAGAQGMPFSRVTGEGLQASDISLPVSTPGATPGNAAAQAPAEPRRLLDLLTDPSLRGDDQAAFTTVYALWGLPYQRASSGLGCDVGRSAGLECVFKLGNWTKLRRFNLPAILELTLPAGQRRNAALVRLDAERATLAIGGREYSFPLGEVDRLWDGSFILIWKSPPLAERVITRGMRGSDIEWLRARLDALEGKTSKGQARDVYDAELERRVIAFQQSRSLVPDGRVGGETIAQLVLAARDAGTPTLLR